MANSALRILYIEDEADIREVATLALENVGGFIVQACASGEESLRALPRFRPNLILLDVMMPGMDGPTTLKKLRELPESRGIPAVFMTAKAAQDEVTELKAIGALGVIPKPFDPMTLSSTVIDIWSANTQARRKPKDDLSSTTMQRIEQIADHFAASLPQRLQKIAEAIQAICGSSADARLRETVRRDLHSLTGSAKTFGFSALSHCARALELNVVPFLHTDRLATSAEAAHLNEALAALLDASAQAREPLVEAEAAAPPAPRSASPTKVVYSLREWGGWINEHRPGLESAGYEIRLFEDAQALMRACTIQYPTALLAQVSSSGTESVRWTEELHRQLREPPPLVLFADTDDFTTRLQAVRVGGAAYFRNPVKTSILIDRLDELGIFGAHEPYRVMIVEDALEQAEYCASVLGQTGVLTCVVSDPTELLHQLEEFHPELVLMDMYLPGCTGDELARVIRQMDAYVSLPIVFLSVEADFDRQLVAMGLGGDEFLTKPIMPVQLTSVVSSRVERYRTLRALMVQDSLTGLANHSRLHQLLETDVARALRHKLPLSLAMIDVDHFKQVNDQHGHPTGDRVLQALARFLKQRLRQADIVARYGGEEFAVVLANTDGNNAHIVIDRLREQFAAIQHESDKGGSFSVTFSAGVTTLQGHCAAREMILAADRALYDAKNSGRNRVVLSR